MCYMEYEDDSSFIEELEQFMPTPAMVQSEVCVRSFLTPSVRGFIKNISVTEGIGFSFIDLTTTRPFQFHSLLHVPHMAEIGFSLKGNIEVALKGQRKKKYDYFQGQSYLSIAQGEIDTEITVPEGQHTQIAEIIFSAASFDRFCSHSGCLLPAAIRPLAESCRQNLITCSCCPPSSLDPLITGMREHALACTDTSLFLERLCIDLAEGLVTFLNGGMQSSGAVLCSKDIERVREARSILSQRLDDPPGLYELSRLVHLNDYKLKTGFRQAFGTTVHQTLRDLRLLKAKQLLADPDMTVSQTALAVGYKNIGDFGIAFKNRFGMNPGQFSQQLYREDAFVPMGCNSI